MSDESGRDRPLKVFAIHIDNAVRAEQDGKPFAARNHLLAAMQHAVNDGWDGAAQVILEGIRALDEAMQRGQAQ